MAKISLSWAINRRKRMRLGTAGAVLLLLFFGVSMMVAKNPKTGQAAASGYNYSTKTLTIDNCAGDIFLEGDEVHSGVRQRIFLSHTCNNLFQLTDYFLPSDATVIVIGSTVTVKALVNKPINLKSLTVGFGGVITHEALIKPDDFDVVTNEITANGLYKSVNLNLSEDLILKDGGKIDVTGKGYPGGTSGYDTANDGYGPGGGTKMIHITDHNDHTCGSGAGYGGVGGEGRILGTTVPGGVVYPDPYVGKLVSSEFFFGSGGGGAAQRDGSSASWANGGDGGGRVSIKANKVYFKDADSVIYANGKAGGYNNGGKGESYGGGGSGGTIWIQTAEINFLSTTGTEPIDYSGGNANGQPGSFDPGDFNPAGLFNLSSFGGNAVSAEFTSPGGGGGGRIVLKKLVSNPVVIRKLLVPVQRDGVANVNFNPYALQKGDRIEVRLSFSNLVSGNSTITLVETLLSVKKSSPVIYCVPKADYGVNNQYFVWDDNDITSTTSYDDFNKKLKATKNIPSGRSTLQASYLCDVN